MKKIRLIFFKCSSLLSNQFTTRETYQQFWYTGVVLITKLDHYFTVSVNPKQERIKLLSKNIFGLLK